MQREIESCVIQTGAPTEKIIENILFNKDNFGFKWAHETADWRFGTNIAIVGGGSTLTETWEELKHYKIIFACGSVHDFLIEKGIIPTYTVVCDPDPLVLNYLRKPHIDCTYLVATQCDPSVFIHLKHSLAGPVRKWNAGGDNLQNEVFGEPAVLVGGGCTVGTRAIVLAYTFGYNNFHLFGFDSCISNGVSHAYPFSDKDKEVLLEVQTITVGGKEFTVAGYMLAQLIDFKKLLKIFGDKAQFTIHGKGTALYALFNSKE